MCQLFYISVMTLRLKPAGGTLPRAEIHQALVTQSSLLSDSSMEFCELMGISFKLGESRLSSHLNFTCSVAYSLL